MIENYSKLKNQFPKIKENIVLRPFTTMGVGGVADLFFVAKNVIDLTKIICQAINLKIPYFILGGGSNILISDSGFPGLVIKNETSNIVRVPDTSQLIVDSGVSIKRLCSEITEQCLTGIEFIAGIPGTVGGAVYGNAGVSGMSIGQFIKEVTVFHPPKGQIDQMQIIKHQASWLEYEYRSSKLKRSNKNSSIEQARPVILTVKIGLAPAKKEDIIKRIQEFISKRTHLPKGKSSGCIFKNPERNPEKSAGAFIDKCHLKKTKIGDAFVSPIHANYIINRGKARAYEIRELIEKVRHAVNHQYGINLEEEIEYVGRW